MADRKLIAECVHCGFCLPACPTYQSSGRETESPRGRIYLMKGRAEAAAPAAWSSAIVENLDHCIGCLACVTACPSGVKYDVLLEQTRGEIEREYRRPVAERLFRTLLFWILPHSGRLRWAMVGMWLAQVTGLRRLFRSLVAWLRLPARWAALEGLLPRVKLPELFDRLPQRTAAVGPQRARVALLPGCVQAVCFSDVNRATLQVLAAEGCEVVIPTGVGCCGALSVHAGREDEARQLIKDTIAALERERFDALITNAAGCGSVMKHWSRLLTAEPEWAARARALEAKVRDLSEWLVSLGRVAQLSPLKLRVAYHDACHLSHGQRIRSQPRELLQAIPGLELLEIPDGDQCCGSGGVYNLLEAESASLVGARKAENVRSVRPNVVASANPGCTLQIQRELAKQGTQVEIVHPVQLLARALAPAR
jgi:glycolate oxidase iron-sulfur subunit